jgi:hypothetical protein
VNHYSSHLAKSDYDFVPSLADPRLTIYSQAVSQRERDANAKVVEMMLPVEAMRFQDPSGSSEVQELAGYPRQATHCRKFVGGPDRDRTDNLFHAIWQRHATN